MENLIVFADHIGKWLYPTTSSPNVYRIAGSSELVVFNLRGLKLNNPMIYTLSRYDNDKGLFKLITDEEAQILFNKVLKPHPNQKVIDKINQMKKIRGKLGYKYV